MVSRRQETNLVSSAPVRFYKIVALTFLVLTVVLLGIIIFMSSKRATITITTKPEPVDVTSEMTVGGGSKDENLPGVVTSTVMHLTQTFHPTGDKEVPGLAGGIVTLHNETNAPQPLVATTRVLSADGVLFHLKSKVVVPANGTVDAEVYADKEGQGGDIAPSKFTIPGLNAEKQKVVYAESKESMAGGMKKTGILSDDDIKKAETTLRLALVEAGKKQLSAGFPDKEGAVAVFEFIADTPSTVGDEVADFALNGRGRVVGVFYDGKEMATKAMALLLKKSVSNTEIIEPGKDAPTVTVERYDADSRVATLSVYQSGQATLNPESQEIQKTVFFGKSKDEVRRYLLSLSHVHAVDVVFRPAWMMSVPQIPDHVQVKVVNVE